MRWPDCHRNLRGTVRSRIIMTTQKQGTLRIAGIMAGIVLLGDFVFDSYQHASFIFLLSAGLTALLVPAFFVQTRTRQAWLFPGILALLLALSSIERIIHPRGKSGLLLAAYILSFVVCMLIAITEGLSAIKRARQGESAKSATEDGRIV